MQMQGCTSLSSITLEVSNRVSAIFCASVSCGGAAGATPCPVDGLCIADRWLIDRTDMVA